MSCVYHFIAPRLEEETRWNAIFQNILFGTGSKLIRLLAVPVLPAAVPLKYGNNNGNKLHELIFSCLDHIDDRICLGLTNQYFWTIGKRFMHKHYMSFYGRWANTNILYAPNDLTLDDLPPGIFSAAEIKQKMQALEAGPEAVPDVVIDTDDLISFSPPHTGFNVDDSDQDDSDDDEFNTGGLYPFALTMTEDCGIPRVRGRSFLNWKSFNLAGRLLAFRPGIEEDPAWVRVHRELLVHESLYFPPDEPWILRNRTTRQIVRTDALAQAPDLVHGPCTHILGLGDAVVMRTGWASTRRMEIIQQEADEEDRNERALGRGVWAGHCFDIVLQSEHEKQTGGGAGWQDVSEEVARELIALQVSEDGPDWLAKAFVGDGKSCRFY